MPDWINTTFDLVDLEPKEEAYYCKYTEDYQICRRCPDIDDPGRPSGTFLDSGDGGGVHFNWSLIKRGKTIAASSIVNQIIIRLDY